MTATDLIAVLNRQRQSAPNTPQCANTEPLAHSGDAGTLWQKANTNHLTSTGS